MEWLAYDVPVGHPQFGKIVRCDVCGPMQQQLFLRSICGLTPEMQDWTFGNTQAAFGIADAYATAQSLMAQPAWMLTLTGPFGIGKTRLLACIINAGRDAGWTSVYMTTAELLDHLRAAYAPGSNITFDGLWEKIVNARILALDELDRWSPTPWAQEKFFELIDLRYRNGAEKLTAFATNAQLDDLPPYLASRMRDRRCRLFELAGVDMRQVRR